MTIKDIAKASGYAVSTVSRALNNHPDVSEQAKREIAAVVEAHQFIPNSNARQLKQQQSRSLSLMVKGANNPLLSNLLEKIQNYTARDGYQTVVHYLDEAGDELAAAHQLCREIKPIGLVFLGGDMEAFRAKFGGITIPSVLVTSLGTGLTFENLSTVGVDDEKAAYMATAHLIENGHTNIAMLGPPPAESSISRNRHNGYCRCLREKLPEGQPPLHQNVGYSYREAYAGMKLLLARAPTLTAVFAASDVVAIGAMRALADAGKRIPADVSIIGFDGMELGQYYNPVLVSVKQPVEEIAEASVALLLRGIERGAPAQNIEMAATLTSGSSVCRLDTANI